MRDPLELWRETFQAGELAADGAQLGLWLDGGERQRAASLAELEKQASEAADAAER